MLLLTFYFSDLGLLESVLQRPAYLYNVVYKHHVDVAFSPFSQVLSNRAAVVGQPN